MDKFDQKTACRSLERLYVFKLHVIPVCTAIIVYIKSRLYVGDIYYPTDLGYETVHATFVFEFKLM